MKLLHKYGTRTNEIRRARRELTLRISMILAVVLLFAGIIIIAKFRPRLDDSVLPPGKTNVGDPLKNPQLIRLRQEVDAIILGFRTKPVDLENMELLERAIDLQREVIRLRGSEVAPRADLDQLEKLLTIYDEEMGRLLIEQSRQLESEAETLRRARQEAEAIEALKKARDLQAELNEQYPRSEGRDPTRLYQLSNRLMYWQTKPLADEADQLKKEALNLIEGRQFNEAKALMQQALSLQQELNESYRGSRSASISRLREFEKAWKDVQVAEEASLVKSLLEEARIALQTEQFSLAISRAEEAEDLQRSIMDRFPTLDSARPEILASISRLKDTAASLPSYKKIRELQESVRDLLRQRNMEPFKNQVSEWLRAMQSFKRTYPNSEFVSELNDSKVTYLHEIREDIPGILEMVYSHLRPIPEFEGQRMYSTEVPQSLFLLIADLNPSSKRDPSLPVDSITWEEANDFLSRLSWILARPVRLPDRDLFMAAMGLIEVAEIRQGAWSSENTDRETQPVGTSKPNPLGFYDLAGNVAEWLSLPPSESTIQATAIGGSVRDNPIRLAQVPEETRNITERNRFVGFRFVVGSPEQAQAH